MSSAAMIGYSSGATLTEKHNVSVPVDKAVSHAPPDPLAPTHLLHSTFSALRSRCTTLAALCMPSRTTLTSWSSTRFKKAIDTGSSISDSGI